MQQYQKVGKPSLRDYLDEDQFKKKMVRDIDESMRNRLVKKEDKIVDHNIGTNTEAPAMQKVSTRRRSSSARPAPTNPYANQIQETLTGMKDAQKPVYQEPAKAWIRRPTYTDSYAKRIKGMEAKGPGTYTSRYQPMIDKTMEQLRNRKFQYNMSEDPLYRQYAAQYAQKGRQAMQDTMGQAAALTGGYGSSYASTAGNQAYQQYLGQLNDKAMDLYSLARQSYDAEGSDMRANLSSLQTAEGMDRSNFESDRADYYNRLASLRQGQSTEYGRYQDQLDQYNAEIERADERERQAWNRYMDEQSLYDQEQRRAWDQYTYWNSLWERRQGY